MTKGVMWWGLALIVVLIIFTATDVEGAREIHEAAVNGNLTQLKELLSEIAPSETQSALTQCYQRPAGNFTCSEGSSSGRASGCDELYHASNECISVLDAAAIGRQPAVVKYLLTDLKAQPNWENSAKKTALHYAFDSFSVHWHPCDDDFRKTVMALLGGGVYTCPRSRFGLAKQYAMANSEGQGNNKRRNNIIWLHIPSVVFYSVLWADLR